VNFALPLRLTVAAAVGIALEAPIFVAIILVFALVGFSVCARGVDRKSLPQSDT
jgi:hypothetical protein